MSTLAVNSVTDANGGNTATINSMTPTADSLQGFRNRIINGDMKIAQRGTGPFTVSSEFPVDRFSIRYGMDGACSFEQTSEAPSGFVNSVKFTTTTADTDLTGTQSVRFEYRAEGQDVADLGWGTAAAKTVTLSFWVRSSLTGTFGGSLVNNAQNRSYPFTYTISSANTWEYKTVTIPGDTTGTWLTTNGIGLRVFFGLGVGPDRSGTAGAWAASSLQSVTGATSVIGTLNATWYVTGVQLEVGSVATPFERRPYGTELSLCQRYYQRQFPLRGVGVGDGASNVGRIKSPLGTTMRASPTATLVGTLTTFDSGVGTITALGSVWVTPDLLEFDAALASGSTASGRCVVIYNNASANTGALSSGGVTLSAEL
jgi:hypothetical protein